MRYFAQYLTPCHWNLNNIAAHNFIKVDLLKAYLSVYEMGIICLFETYLVSSVSRDNDNQQIPGNSSVGADCGGVLIHSKYFLPKKLIDAKYSHESFNFELKIGGKIYKFLSLYRSLSQNKCDIETFLEYVELNFDHLTKKTLS